VLVIVIHLEKSQSGLSQGNTYFFQELQKNEFNFP